MRKIVFHGRGQSVCGRVACGRVRCGRVRCGRVAPRLGLRLGPRLGPRLALRLGLRLRTELRSNSATSALPPLFRASPVTDRRCLGPVLWLKRLVVRYRMVAMESPTSCWPAPLRRT
jgi:hypothetical protein